MRNLFVCHTQAHLILATGLSLGRFKNEENHLILFKDFNLSESLSKKLNGVFASTLYLTGIYPTKNRSLFARIRWHSEDNRMLRKHVVEAYDRVFAVCDWTPPVQYCLKRCKDLNINTEFIWLEDGILSYFPNIEIATGSERFIITKFLRKVFFKYFAGFSEIYERDFNAMGGLKIFRKMYTLYPDAVREPYRSQRSLVQILDSEYIVGVLNLYDKLSLNIDDHSILLVMDKLDTYLYPDKIKQAIISLKENARKEGKKVYCKFHPREEIHWEEFNDCSILDKYVGAEALYISLIEKKNRLSIIGVKSAGLMSAKKLGFSVYSLFNHSGEKNVNLLSFFKHIHIKLL